MTIQIYLDLQKSKFKMSEKLVKRKSPVGGPPRRVKKPKNDEQALTVFEKIKDFAGAILANPPVPTTQEILTTETKTKKRRVDPPRPATDIDVSDVLQNACRKFLIIVLRNAFLQWFAATVVPYETYKDLRTPYKKKEQDLIDKYVQKIKEDRENEVEIQELKQQLAEYKKQHGHVNVTAAKNQKLRGKIDHVRNRHRHIVKNPIFFDWLLDEGKLIMAFKPGTTEKDEKKHQEQIEKVRAKQEKEKEAFGKKKYRVDTLQDRFPKIKDELAALNEECLKEFHAYLEECKIASKNNRHPIYGIPAPLKKNIHGDALVVYYNTYSENLDERGKRVTLDFAKEHWIQRDGGIYTLKKNGEKASISYGSTRELTYKLKIKDGIARLWPAASPPISLLVLFSYFPHLDWKPFCRAAGRPIKGKVAAEVDHVKQVHEKCHFAYLEAVPGPENMYRNKFSATHSTRRKKQAETKGKPFHIFHDGKPIPIFTASTSEKGAAFLKNEFPETYVIKEHTLSKKIRSALEPKSRDYKQLTNYFSKQKITLAYTKEHSDSQLGKDDETWSYNPLKKEKHPKGALTWKQPNDPRLKGCKLLAISDKGRIMLSDGQIGCGTLLLAKRKQKILILDDERAKRKTAPTKIHSYYLSKAISEFVWPAFEEEERGKRMVLHRNGDQYLRTNEDGKTINVYNNHLESLYLGDAAQNAKDRVDDEIAWDRQFPEREARLYDPSGRCIPGTFYSVIEIRQKHKDIFRKNIYKVWEGEIYHFNGGYTIEFVIPRPGRPPCVRVGKKMIDKKTKKLCVIKKLKPGSVVEIEFCDNKQIESRRNSVTNPAFEDITGDEGPTDDEIIAAMEAT